MKRKEENRSVIEPSCTFFKPNKINVLPSNRVLDQKPDRVTGYKILIDLTSLIFRVLFYFQILFQNYTGHRENYINHMFKFRQNHNSVLSQFTII